MITKRSPARFPGHAQLSTPFKEAALPSGLAGDIEIREQHEYEVNINF
jgi:hypothetical protein